MKPPTLEQWRRWNETATRNWTDDPVGARTAAKRDKDARNSKLVTDISPKHRTIAGEATQRPVAASKCHPRSSDTPRTTQGHTEPGSETAA